MIFEEKNLKMQIDFSGNQSLSVCLSFIYGCLGMRGYSDCMLAIVRACVYEGDSVQASL